MIRALHRYFWSFHHLVDLMVRVAVNEEAVTKLLIGQYITCNIYELCKRTDAVFLVNP